MAETKSLYVMISRTDTGVGKLIRRLSRYPYNHVSLSLDPTFKTWVSFARYVQNVPLYGGFIVEPAERFLAKGERIDVRIFRLDIPEEQHSRLERLFSMASQADGELLYNTFDVLAAAVGGRFAYQMPTPAWASPARCWSCRLPPLRKWTSTSHRISATKATLASW